jgi:hypothetical protein
MSGQVGQSGKLLLAHTSSHSWSPMGRMTIFYCLTTRGVVKQSVCMITVTYTHDTRVCQSQRGSSRKIKIAQHAYKGHTAGWGKARTTEIGSNSRYRKYKPLTHMV